MKQMPIHNTRYTIVVAIVSGLILFIMGAVWAAYFLPTVPIEQGAVSDWISFEGVDGHVHYEPGEFRSELDLLKYYHNVKIGERNKYWLFLSIALGALFGRFAFYTFPKWSGISKADLDEANSQVSGMVVGGLIALFMPHVFSWILPSPDIWFPSFITEYSHQRQHEVLTELEWKAAQSDN